MNRTKLIRNSCRRFLSRPVRKVVWLLAGAAATMTVVQAQLLIDVGDHVLQPNMSQTLDLFVHNPTGNAVEVGGLNFNLQLNQTGPVIQNVNIVTGTLFASNNTGQDNNATLNHLWAAAVITSGLTTETLAPQSSAKLATVTINTAGFSSGGPWSISLNDTVNGPTRYLDSFGAPIGATITDGTLTVVPEPNAALVVAGLLLGLAGVRRWGFKS